MHTDFVASRDNMQCSLSTFFRNKPFYITPSSEKEKKSHVFVLNAKEISYYIFEIKTESFTKNGKITEYSRAARVDKKEKVCEIVKKLLDRGESYLRHRSHLDNIAAVLPMIRESFSGKYIELDFSENLALKPKHEVQDAHFSGKQYSLHCSIVEPGENKYVYHLSDDTNHDPVFVNEDLEDIFKRWNIKDETIIIKSDNAPTQYKNKFVFQSMVSLSNKYNVRIIRIYGAAAHDKGLIDAMSSFGVKAILRRDIVSHDCWFESSNDICEYLSSRCDSRMSYTNLDPKSIDEKRQNKEGHKI